jgi:hypothetical protein
MNMFLALLLISIGALLLGLAHGTRVYESKVGTAFGITICTLAFGLLVWQLFLLPLNYTHLRIALASIVLVMQTCTAGEMSRRNASPNITVRQGIVAMFCILAAATVVARFYQL